MFLKMLATNKLINVDFYKNGSLKTLKGSVHKIDPRAQKLFLKDEKQKVLLISLSEIKAIY
ncbi:YolD-like family protein [Bacillus sp. CMF12]|uniref:YolD-like family protein n=1 Tax=Bacillaceae TaxID=186817 RepID=UPI001C8E8196|nr:MULTISPECIES: YolD-like family protein [Bacillaceae]MBX9974836.1 YolD-like family protein [Cytobacillus firmus]MDF2035883.1 YolD-like family protein [Cytobacillus oceanisediminis]UOE53186.1 YolD-like family protein [Cytobacillus oceanisediminis]USK47633.1 YolD-like family protein [Bacillus sp. CMF12]